MGLLGSVPTPVLRLIAFSILLIPVAVLGVFAVGGLLTGDSGSVRQFVLVIPLIVIAIVGQKKPFVSGSILLIVALSLAITYPLFLTGLSLDYLLGTGLILFGPPTLAGVIFMIIGHRGERQS
jgi:hypothetical protein